MSSFFEDAEETLAQAKRRALTYLDAGDPVAAAVSMVSDLIRHPVVRSPSHDALRREGLSLAVAGDVAGIRRWIEKINPEVSVSLEQLASAVLLFHFGEPWTDDRREAWTKLTGRDEVTPEVLGDLARLALRRDS